MVQVPTRHSRALLREMLLPILCAFIALSGIVEARALAKRAIAGPSAAFALCVAGHAPAGAEQAQGGANEDPATSHDCTECCLPAPLALAPRLATILPAQVPAHRAAERATAPLSRPEPRILPWSRGPPDAA